MPSARPVIARETPVAALVDARRGFGQHSTMFALEWAMARARQHGVAMVAVRHSTHIGRLGEYAERTAAEGLIGIVTVGAVGAGIGGVVPFGGRARFLGTNPWALSVPGRSRSLIFDAATSTVAEGKVRVARAAGKPLPPDAILDRDGRSTRDAADFYAGGALLPLGGTLAGHKGYGLGLASALLGALGMIGDAEPTLVGAAPPEAGDARGRIAGVFLEVVDPAAFGDAARYAELVDEALDAAKRQPPADGVAEVLVPGEPERVDPERGGAARACRCPRRGPSSGRSRPGSACRSRRPGAPEGRSPAQPALRGSGRPVLDGLLHGLVHLFGGDQDRRPEPDGAARAHGQGDGRGARGVGQLDEHEGIGLAVGGVESLEPPAQALGH